MSVVLESDILVLGIVLGTFILENGLMDLASERLVRHDLHVGNNYLPRRILGAQGEDQRGGSRSPEHAIGKLMKVVFLQMLKGG